MTGFVHNGQICSLILGCSCRDEAISKISQLPILVKSVTWRTLTFMHLSGTFVSHFCELKEYAILWSRWLLNNLVGFWFWTAACESSVHIVCFSKAVCVAGFWSFIVWFNWQPHRWTRFLKTRGGEGSDWQLDAGVCVNIKTAFVHSKHSQRGIVQLRQDREDDSSYRRHTCICIKP